ncbi:hypothetical protein H5M16_004802 [Salmonella enterica]|nr:hypothetical protein [Salmonella enterica]
MSMTDDKKIAALIGHHKQTEQVVTALLMTLKQESELLRECSQNVSRDSRELNSKIYHSVKQILDQNSSDLNKLLDTKKENILKSFLSVSEHAEESVCNIRKEMNRLSWKNAVYLAAGFFLCLGVLFGGVTIYMYYHESEIRKLQEQHEIWLKKAPYADITTCGKDKKPCVLIDEKAGYFYNKKDPSKKYAIISKP